MVDIIYTMVEYDRKLIEYEKDREPLFSGGGKSVSVCTETVPKVKTIS
jgi:hypothetical protein